ncbi:MAG: adenosine kinase [Bacteroidales bacterium]|jgi:sugar/nucleoside kinase (ribokinase family)|nr:adenosine kinase [Bacteroidales bacterium]
MKKILGMGNALVDIMTLLPDDETLTKFELPKGSMQLVDYNFHNNIQNYTKSFKKQLASGGSAANTIHGLSKLGAKCGFIGKVGQDEMGQFFKKDMIENNIEPFLTESETNSGVATALVSKDSERTFATYLGAASELIADNIDEKTFEGFGIFYIEGYLVQNHELIEKAVKTAKEKGLEVALDLASYNVVEDNFDFIQRIVKDYVDIVFANEEEAKAFTGKEPQEALIELGKFAKIAIVKIGKKGSLILKDGIVSTIQGLKANSIDTTGAGDSYAAGFLYGYVNNKSMETCGNMGSFISAKVVEVVGPKLNEDIWKEIREHISTL